LLFATACGVASRHYPGGALPDAPDHTVTIIDAPDLVDGAPGCAISSGVTPMLGGSDDLAAYPSAQQVPLGATMGSDGAAIAWDADKLYITASSPAFTDPYTPLHVYIQTGGDLGGAVPSQGKQYSNLTPALPFTPTFLVAVRRTSNSGTDGPYDGIYVPANAWNTPVTPLESTTDVFASEDDRTLSVQVAWQALGGCPTTLRLVMHVVNAVAGSDWTDVAPTTHTPWQSPGGGYYQADLTGSAAIADWMVNP
jgi:hypothetical protein